MEEGRCATRLLPQAEAGDQGCPLARSLGIWGVGGKDEELHAALSYGGVTISPSPAPKPSEPVRIMSPQTCDKHNPRHQGGAQRSPAPRPWPHSALAPLRLGSRGHLSLAV